MNSETRAVFELWGDDLEQLIAEAYKIGFSHARTTTESQAEEYGEWVINRLKRRDSCVRKWWNPDL